MSFSLLTPLHVYMGLYRPEYRLGVPAATDRNARAEDYANFPAFLCHSALGLLWRNYVTASKVSICMAL
jgi:hypothetical protein